MRIEEKQRRIEHLKAMDICMRQLEDEDYFMWWLQDGVPDGTTDYEWLADDHYYYNCLYAFTHIMRKYAEEYEHEIKETMEDAEKKFYEEIGIPTSLNVESFLK